MEYVIYKIVCDDLDIKFTYVGITTNFTRRKCQHKWYSNNEKKVHLKLYSTIKANGGWDNWTMVKIENRMCESTLDARKMERWWYEHLNADLNTYRPMCTSEEDKVRCNEYNKQYYYNNRLDIQECKNQYYIENKERLQLSRKYIMRKIKKEFQHVIRKEFIVKHASPIVIEVVYQITRRPRNIWTIWNWFDHLIALFTLTMFFMLSK